LVLIGIAIFALVMVTHGLAVSTQTAPNGYATTVSAGTYPVFALPLRTPVSISISDSGTAAYPGSYGTASIVACCDGTSWSWIGLNGNGTVARGNNWKTANTIMAATGITGEYVVLYSPTSGQVRVYNATAYPVRVYIHW
jgi:hypothetical protein